MKRTKSPGRVSATSAPASARSKSPGRAKSPGRRGGGADAPRELTKKQKRWKEQHAADSDDEEQDESTEVMPAAMQRKIMTQARLQQEEVETQNNRSSGASFPSARPRTKAKHSADEMPDDEDDGGAGVDDDEEEAELAAGGEYYEDVEELELGEDDERALDLLMGGSAPARTLADVIMDKINERNAALTAGDGEPGADEEEVSMELPPKVQEVYASVGKLLSTYRSGKLPKAFKIVPRLANWEEVLYATDPDGWTPAATCEATRLFASNLNPKMAQRYFNLVLLPAVQRDIKAHGKLNFHLYLALKRALYKPSAFFKGLLLPLCEARCTVREALIIASVLQKVSVPMLHSAVAILKLAEMDFTPANALFLRTLLLKKYALPYRVVDALVDYFEGFTHADELPPVLWQQTLLAFAQHYKSEVTDQQKETLKAVLRAQSHPQITPEIRRELLSGRARGAAYIPNLAGAEPVAMDE